MKERILSKVELKDLYVILLIAALGIFAFVSAVLISWPALAYLGSKAFLAF